MKANRQSRPRPNPRAERTARVPRPSKAELQAAATRTVPDVIGPDLQVLFCGINPGLYSAWAGHHFARPGNRFWPVLFASGFTDRLLLPQDEAEMLGQGFGLTNLVARATLGSQELGEDELRAGRRALEAKIRRFRPGAVAVLGVSAFRLAFDRPAAALGAQSERIAGALIWVLPNPSGLNAHFTPPALATLFRRFRRAIQPA